MIYQPLEDSFLLEKEVKRHARGNVLDIGTGSAIQAVAAAKKRNVKKVIALDVQKDVIEFCKKEIKNKKINFFQSNLFDYLKKSREFRNRKFDTIIFNPPYLPAEPKLRDLTVEGGKKGFELVGAFLKEAKDFLKDGGIILLLISSLTNKPKVEEMLTKGLYEFDIIAEKHIFFEDLFVYMIRKNSTVLKLHKKRINSIRYFTKGHRGMLFTGKYKNKKVTIKAKLPESKAEGRIANEAKWLKRLNKSGIGPKIVMSNRDYFAYWFVEGDFIADFIGKSTKKAVKMVFEAVLKQCHKLDRIKVDKEEMHRPYKHILVKGNKPVLIDFERCHKSKKPKNVTQFLQFISSSYLEMSLRLKRIYINRKILIRIAKEYKKSGDIKPVVEFVQEL
jgi:HemK-related putative methylase